jgi:FtsP/CotA-like multicopper oxidase with cupredoxin domain
VTHETTNRRAPYVSRRTVLRAGVIGAVGAGALSVVGRSAFGAGSPSSDPVTGLYRSGAYKKLHLAATDGWVSMPTSAPPVSPFWPDPWAPAPYNMYVFGFRNVTAFTDAEVIAQRGLAQISAPVIGVDEGDEIEVSLTNLGLSMRPDLVDGHTLHWHGFNNAIPIFDGVPEMSASVPVGKSMTYYYRPHDPGTYMYHCHFEDVEHVQMGMTGLIFVRPKNNTYNPLTGSGQRFAYNDPSTAYDREFAVFMTENQPEAHYRDAHIQVTDWADYKPGFSLFNGRAYPDTIAPDTDPMTDYAPGSDQARLRYQPHSSLITCNAGETILLRVASLGSLRHTLTIDGVPLHVVGGDASQLKNPDGTDNSYVTNSVEVAPGQARDILFTAPTQPGTYRLYDRDYMNLSNNGAAGYGGMLTEVRVSPAGTLPPQTYTADYLKSQGV